VHLWVLSHRLSSVFGPDEEHLPKGIGADDVHWYRDAIYISKRKRFKPGRWLVDARDPRSSLQSLVTQRPSN